jgi:hypothetical protein
MNCTNCGADSERYSLCRGCHDDLKELLEQMTSGFVVCTNCETTTRPGVVLFSGRCCPRCKYDLSGDPLVKRL